MVDFTGDNFLAEFSSAVAAVECAVEMQAVLGGRNANLAAERRMDFRMDLHLGEVQVEGERIFGNGVNIAARLEGLADSGGVCVSATIQEQMSGAPAFDFEDLGPQEVKNIADPVRVFRVRSRPRTGVQRGATRSERPSIVVLPFINMSSDSEQEYFCDGMAEEVINALTQLAGLDVVARTSAFQFKGRGLDVREIGDKLGVRSVLEGSVRKAGDRLRITAQLINVADGYHLWSDRFDRRLDDVFAIQDEISASIVETLKVKLGVGEVAPKAKRTENQEAYDLYLRGKRHAWAVTEEAFKKAISCLEQALALDPEFASAHAALAEIYSFWSLSGRVSAHEALSRAEPAALRALEIDDSLAEAHSAVANVSLYLNWDRRTGEREFLRSIEISPGLAGAHSKYATGCLTPVGRTEGVARRAAPCSRVRSSVGGNPSPDRRGTLLG